MEDYPRLSKRAASFTNPDIYLNSTDSVYVTYICPESQSSHLSNGHIKFDPGLLL